MAVGVSHCMRTTPRLSSTAMFKGLKRQRWTCPQCMRIQTRRLNSIAAAVEPTSTSAAAIRPASFSPPGAQFEDTTLRQIFDNPALGSEFTQNIKNQVTGKRVGLFLNEYLKHPDGFKSYAEATLQKCHTLVTKILSASSAEEYKNMARDMDRLSDLLCRVIDLSDFVRATHSDRRFRAAATNAYTMMLEYMNTLNTNTGLHEQLERAAAMPEVWDTWSEEEKVVANILMRDFSKSAIHLPEEARRDFVDISNEIAEVGTEFVDGMAPEKTLLAFESGKLKGMDPSIVRESTTRGRVAIPTVGGRAVLALKTVDDPDVRREVYLGHRTASKSSIMRLERLLKARSRLAKLSGYQTFAHLALSDKMAKTPEAVTHFLSALAADTRPQVTAELQDLLELKQADARTGLFSNTINAWDRDYYTSRLLSRLFARVRTGDILSSHFSLGTVFQGLSRLFSRLYGIRLVPCETQPGETWHEDVRRLDVVDESGNHIAVVYCDLFSRAGKNPNPAHFTLRCSRAIPDAEVAEYATGATPFKDPVEAATDGMAHFIDPNSKMLYQLPTIALICDFSRPASRDPSMLTSGAAAKPTLLSFRDVQTLFHEMGHALHSVLGRTSLQNVSGTRCATDFAELPSVLMEHFAFAPPALALWARHWQTDSPLPFALVAERLEIERRMEAQETEAQILLACLDQAYHAEDLERRSGDGWSTDVFHDVWGRYASVAEPRGTSWQGFFGHLYGYGATYYSYLFDRAIAKRVWNVVFESGEKCLDRDMGERYKEEVLKWGGGRDPWRCVASVLGDEKLADGGEEAMKEVGRWGVSEGKGR